MFFYILEGETEVILLFCCRLFWIGVDGSCSAGSSAIHIGANDYDDDDAAAAAYMTFCSCGQFAVCAHKR